MFAFSNSTVANNGILSFPFWLALVSIALLFSSTGTAQQQKRRTVLLEVTWKSGGEIGSQQRWGAALQDVGADKVTLRTSVPEEPTAEEMQLGSATVIKVTGFIGPDF